jgi:hypothetical protein
MVERLQAEGRHEDALMRMRENPGAAAAMFGMEHETRLGLKRKTSSDTEEDENEDEEDDEEVGDVKRVKVEEDS